MKIQNITDIKGFFKALEKCHGNVYLRTEDGDKLNLKSKLTQYVALASVFEDGHIDDVEITFDVPADMQLMLKYLIAR